MSKETRTNNRSGNNALRAVLIRLDGAVVPVIGHAMDAANETLAGLGSAAIDDEAAAALVIDGLEVGFINVLKEHVPKDQVETLDIADVLRRYRKAFLRRARTAPEAVDGLIGVLRDLKKPDGRGDREGDRGGRVAAFTELPTNDALTLFDQGSLEELFDVVVGADQVEFLPPSPEIFVRAMRDLGLKKTDGVAVVSDNFEDLLAAEQAGLRAIGVNWGVTPLPALDLLTSMDIPYVRSANELARLLTN